MKSRGMRKAVKVLGFILFFVAMVVVAMLLWNALIPQIFEITAINFWQSAGLLILARLFFGGLGHGHHGFMGRMRGGHSHKFGHHFGNKEMKEKLKSMSREERREYIREHMRGHHSHCDCDKHFGGEDSSKTED